MKNEIVLDSAGSSSPFQSAEFRKLFAAQLIALSGTGLATVALTLLAYDLAGGNAGLVLGQALAVKMIAYVFVSPLMGGIAHRFDRKRLLISLDLARALIVLGMPFVTEVWQIFSLIFLLNSFSAGFKPVFQATIPELMQNERAYSRALSYSRLAYDLEMLLSPMLAGLALLFFSYSALFITNSITYLVSAGLILIVVFPAAEKVDRLGGVWGEISFGIRAYLRTPRLRGMLALYLGVAAASAMIIVNTVIYVRENLGGTESAVALALAATGAGSMITALMMPRILDQVADRTVMILGSVIMSAGLLVMVVSPNFSQLLVIWFVIGIGWSLVQTPSGRVVNRSSSPADRSSYFSAQFSLSHACWMFAYPLVGWMGVSVGIEMTSLYFGIAVAMFTLVAIILWPANDLVVLEHTHEALSHSHEHSHVSHHDHEHTHEDKRHKHEHKHQPLTHSHVFVIDDHHPSWP
ncbi:MAG: MFS transporter [Pseudomonadales bacterium]|jgi:MFS family permease